MWLFKKFNIQEHLLSGQIVELTEKDLFSMIQYYCKQLELCELVPKFLKDLLKACDSNIERKIFFTNNLKIFKKLYSVAENENIIIVPYCIKEKIKN